jgi:hypothetical protein
MSITAAEFVSRAEALVQKEMTELLALRASSPEFPLKYIESIRITYYIGKLLYDTENFFKDEYSECSCKRTALDKALDNGFIVFSYFRDMPSPHTLKDNLVTDERNTAIAEAYGLETLRYIRSLDAMFVSTLRAKREINDEFVILHLLTILPPNPFVGVTEDEYKKKVHTILRVYCDIESLRVQKTYCIKKDRVHEATMLDVEIERRVSDMRKIF